MKIKKLIEINFLVIILGLSACTAVPATPTLDATALVTQVAQTLRAQYTQTAQKQPSVTPQPGSPTPNSAATLLPTAVPLATTTPTTSAIITLAPNATLGATAAPQAAGTLAPVAAPAAEFAVVHVFTSVNHASLSASCPPGYTFEFAGSIATNGPGTVTYNWEFSDGSKTDDQTLEFSAAETKNISTSWTIGADGKTPGDNPYKGWARITINQPQSPGFFAGLF